MWHRDHGPQMSVLPATAAPHPLRPAETTLYPCRLLDANHEDVDSVLLRNHSGYKRVNGFNNFVDHCATLLTPREN